MSALSDIERAILKAIKHRGSVDLRRGMGLRDGAQEFLSEKSSLSVYEVMDAVSSLIARRMAYIDFSQSDVTYWSVKMSERGYSVLEEGTPSPADRNIYLTKLLAAYPTTTPEIIFYLTEALKAFEGEAYAASTVMVGVAAEQCFYEVGDAFCCWLEEKPREKFEEIFRNPKVHYIYKMQEFQKRLMASKGLLTSELGDSLETQVVAAMHLLRANRNDAGHPTKVLTDHHTAYTNLAIYYGLHKKLYALKEFFKQNAKV